MLPLIYMARFIQLTQNESFHLLVELYPHTLEAVNRKMGLVIQFTQVVTTCSVSVWGMEEYLRNLSEFEARFATEQACREYLFLLRWPESFRCPSCGFDRLWPVRSVWLQCRHCDH
ncbi:MAG: transposase [Acidobacteriaceae bacterium]